MLSGISPMAIDSSIGVLEHLPPQVSPPQARLSPSAYDRHGFSSYARVVSGLLYFFLEDRQAAKNTMWALRHILALTLYARDFLRIPSAPSQVFSQHALQDGLVELLSK